MKCIGLYIRKSIHSIIYKISKEDWRGQGEGGGVKAGKMPLFIGWIRNKLKNKTYSFNL